MKLVINKLPVNKIKRSLMIGFASKIGMEILWSYFSRKKLYEFIYPKNILMNFGYMVKM